VSYGTAVTAGVSRPLCGWAAERAGLAVRHRPGRGGGHLILRRYQHGPSVFRVDYALSGPVPWTSPEARRAGTAHLRPTLDETGGALGSVRLGAEPRPPFLIAA
jgi:hypothetical protein